MITCLKRESLLTLGKHYGILYILGPIRNCLYRGLGRIGSGHPKWFAKSLFARITGSNPVSSASTVLDSLNMSDPVAFRKLIGKGDKTNLKRLRD